MSKDYQEGDLMLESPQQARPSDYNRQALVSLNTDGDDEA